MSLISPISLQHKLLGIGSDEGSPKDCIRVDSLHEIMSKGKFKTLHKICDEQGKVSKYKDLFVKQFGLL